MTTKKLTLRQKILVAGTLFGMFFGAGNLIFPVHLGQMAGQNTLPAIIGFIITAVGIVGLGLIGGSFAKAYHAAGWTVLGHDADESGFPQLRDSAVESQTVTAAEKRECRLAGNFLLQRPHILNTCFL